MTKIPSHVTTLHSFCGDWHCTSQYLKILFLRLQEITETLL